MRSGHQSWTFSKSQCCFQTIISSKWKLKGKCDNMRIREEQWGQIIVQINLYGYGDNKWLMDVECPQLHSVSVTALNLILIQKYSADEVDFRPMNTCFQLICCFLYNRFLAPHRQDVLPHQSSIWTRNRQIASLVGAHFPLDVSRVLLTNAHEYSFYRCPDLVIAIMLLSCSGRFCLPCFF